MGPLIRAIAYGSLYIGVVLVFLPARVLEWSGVTRPLTTGPVQIVAAAIAAGGLALALWCILTFVIVGRGTPAPFDPPRRLVVSGPYRYVRNPMYIGVALALAGATLFYRSLALLGYATLFVVVVHLFIVTYEEPTLRSTFGQDYEVYSSRVNRWWPSYPGMPRGEIPAMPAEGRRGNERSE